MNELMGCHNFWIGYDRQGNDTSWKWTSGDASTFEAWGGRGPGASRGGFDCAYQSTLGKWYATFCNMEVRYPFVCKLAQDSAWTWPTAAPTTIAPSVSPKPTMDLDLPLALAIDGTKDTFYYDAPLWTNDKLLDDGGESKTDAFFTPSTTFTVMMRTGSEERTLLVELSHPKSLKELFSGGYTKTSASLDSGAASCRTQGTKNTATTRASTWPRTAATLTTFRTGSVDCALGSGLTSKTTAGHQIAS